MPIAMQTSRSKEFKKRVEGASSAVPLTTGASNTRRLFVVDPTTKLTFLVDSGADVSVLPPSSDEKRSKHQSLLYAANESTIKTYGTRTATISIGLGRKFTWRFIIADVSSPLLGADFLHAYELVIDLANGRLIDRVTNTETKNLKYNRSEITMPIGLSTVRLDQPFTNLVNEYIDVTSPIKHDEVPTPAAPSTSTTHHILTKGPPLSSKARRLNGEKLAAAKREFKLMVERGICRPSKSPWASPLHLVTKKDGTFRPTGDYRRLNAVTIPDAYPIPHLNDVQWMLRDKQIFTTLDLERAYHQIPMEECDIVKTAIITPFGLFEFPRMSFGLRNASRTFQRYIDQILQ